MSLDKSFGFGLEDIKTYAVAITAALLEEFVSHPIGSVTAIILLLLTYDKWRTQRFERKMKEREYERTIERDAERDQGSEN
jgi:hypothetical protein